MEFTAHSGTGAQWVDIKYAQTDDRELIYVEPATDRLIRADTLFQGVYWPIEIRVTGQFIDQAGYPRGYLAVKGAEPAKVFRYRKIKVLKRGDPPMK